MKPSRTLPLVLSPALLLLAACGGQAEEPPEAAAAPTLPERYWAAEAPVGALDVNALHGKPDGEAVVVQGEVKDFVEGRAAFTLADLALTSCADMNMGADDCPTPWDFCCEDPDALRRGTALVEFREDGRLLESRVAGFHGLDHLTDVVIRGTLSVDEAGNLTVVADALHALP